MLLKKWPDATLRVSGYSQRRRESSMSIYPVSELGNTGVISSEPIILL